MSQVKVAIIYYSATGTNYTLARSAEFAALATGAEVRFRKVQELAPEVAIASNPAWKGHYEQTQQVPTVALEDLEWADAIVFSFPTRFGGLPSQMKQFIDMAGRLWAEGKLANKVVTGMTSASNAQGGQEAALLSLYTSMYHWGAIVVAPGYTDPAVFHAGGNPYGTSATVSPQKPQVGPEILSGVEHQTKRLIQVAQWIKQGQSL